MTKQAEDIQEPDVQTSHSSPFINVRIHRTTHSKMEGKQRETGIRTKSSLVDWLFATVDRQNVILPATVDKVFEDDTPVVICGPPGCGKSRFTRDEILPKCTPVLLIDVAGEYPSLKKVSLPQILSMKWSRHTGDKVRLVPSTNPLLFSAEMSSLFGYLNGIKSEGFKPGIIPSGKLSAWIIICEESHRLKTVEAFNLFLLEARKYCKKIILVCSDPQLYGSFCTSLRPSRELQENVQATKT